MTFAWIIGLAYKEAIMNNYVTSEECQAIYDFAKTWRDLAGVELEDLDLRKRAEL